MLRGNHKKDCNNNGIFCRTNFLGITNWFGSLCTTRECNILIPINYGQLTKGEIKKGEITGGNITKGTVQNETVTGADIKGANITGAEITGVDISKVHECLLATTFCKSKCYLRNWRTK